MKQLSLVSALFSQQEVEQEPTVLDPWPTAYIVDTHGHVYTHRKLGGGGQVTLKTKDRPERLKDLETTFSEKINHLPGGKIPLSLFSQICSFFKKVMKDKGYDKSTNMSASTGWRSSNEAMAHILWNTETREYEVGIPTQKVSTAAVDFSYDDVKPHHIIVVDVHSHNNMGAFWSPRDDKEDAKGIWFSGVVGTIDKGPSTNWRFSMNGEFRSMKFEDIYSGEFQSVSFEEEVPEEWMDKVSQYVYSSTYTGTGYQGTGYGGRQYTGSQGSGYQYSGRGSFSIYDELDEEDYVSWLTGATNRPSDTRNGSVIAFGGSRTRSDTFHGITFTELKQDMTEYLSLIARMGHAAAASSTYRPRVTALPKADMGQALFTVLECFDDNDIEVILNAFAKSMSHPRRNPTTRHKVRSFLRSLDRVLAQNADPIQPSYISK